MRVRTFFRNYMLIPVVLIPIFTFAFFILTWQGGLSMSMSKKLLPVLFGLPVIISFLVISIVVIVRLTRKLPVLLLVQVLVIEIIVMVAFFVLDYQRSTWMLNQMMYQDKRQAFVTRLKTNPNSGEEKAAMMFIDTARNVKHTIQLHGDEIRLQNKLTEKGSSSESVSDAVVLRDCDGNLLVEFVYDDHWLTGNYVILYSEKKPMPEHRTYSDSYNVQHSEYCDMIFNYKVVDTISPNWYYAESLYPWHYSYLNDENQNPEIAGTGGCP